MDDAGLATVRRVPFGEGSDAKRMVMLPLHTAAAGTPLYNLRRALVRIEDLSHVLLWSTSDPESYAAAGAGDAEQCALSLLELPRLRLRFQMRGTRFESLNYSGHFISNRPWGSGALASRSQCPSWRAWVSVNPPAAPIKRHMSAPVPCGECVVMPRASYSTPLILSGAIPHRSLRALGPWALFMTPARMAMPLDGLPAHLGAVENAGNACLRPAMARWCSPSHFAMANRS